MAVRAGLSPFEASNTASMYTSPYPEMPSALPQYKAKVDSFIGSGAFQQQAPTEQQAVEQPAKVYVNTGTNQYFVNGLMFDIDDHTQAVESERYLSLPEMRVPEGDGWQEVDRNSYQGFVDKIKDPSLGTVYAKNVGRGVDILQDLGGNALQLIGDTTRIDWLSNLGSDIADQQELDLSKTEVYQGAFTDIDNGGDAVNWFVGVLGQQTPIIAEVIASFAAGYALGGFHPFSGGAVGLGAAAITLLKSIGIRKAAVPIMKKQLKKEFDDAFTAAIKAQKKGKKFSTLSALNQKRIRQATGITAVFANNYAFGMGDLYGELKGTDPENAIWKSWVLAYPYAMAETMPEMILAGRLLGGIRGKGGILRRLRTGVIVGGLAEGGVETFQETLLLASNPEIDLTSPEGFNRLVNSFAAGAAIGVPIGGAANVFAGGAPALTGEEMDLLDQWYNEPEVRQWSERPLSEIAERIKILTEELTAAIDTRTTAKDKGDLDIKIAARNREIALMKAVQKKLANEANVGASDAAILNLATQLARQFNIEAAAEEVVKITGYKPVDTKPTTEQIEAEAVILRDKQQEAVDILAEQKKTEEAAQIPQELVKEQERIAAVESTVEKLDEQIKAAQEQLTPTEGAWSVTKAKEVLEAYAATIAALKAQGHSVEDIVPFSKLSAEAQQAFANKADVVKQKIKDGELQDVVDLIKELPNIEEKADTLGTAERTVLEEKVKKLEARRDEIVEGAEKKHKATLAKRKVEVEEKVEESNKLRQEVIDNAKDKVAKIREKYAAGDPKISPLVARADLKALRKIQRQAEKLGVSAPLLDETIAELEEVIKQKKTQVKKDEKAEKAEEQEAAEIAKAEKEATIDMFEEPGKKKLKKKATKKPVVKKVAKKVVKKKAEKKPAVKKIVKKKVVPKVTPEEEEAAAAVAAAAEAEVGEGEVEAHEAKTKKVVKKVTEGTAAAAKAAKAKAVKFWDKKVIPLAKWAGKLEIVLGDLDDSVQLMLIEGTKSAEEIIAELESVKSETEEGKVYSYPFWMAAREAVRDGSDQGLEFIGRLFDASTKKKDEGGLIDKVYQALKEAHQDSLNQKVFSDTGYTVLMTLLEGEILAKANTSTGDILISDKSGTTTAGDIVQEMRQGNVTLMKHLIQNRKASFSVYNPETGKQDIESLVESKRQAKIDKTLNEATANLEKQKPVNIVTGLLEKLSKAPVAKTTEEGNVAKVQKAFAALTDEQKNSIYNEVALKNYFTKGGKLKLNSSTIHAPRGAGVSYKPSSKAKNFFWAGMPSGEKQAIRKAIEAEGVTAADIAALKKELTALKAQQDTWGKEWYAMSKKEQETKKGKALKAKLDKYREKTIPNAEEVLDKAGSTQREAAADAAAKKGEQKLKKQTPEKTIQTRYNDAVANNDAIINQLDRAEETKRLIEEKIEEAGTNKLNLKIANPVLSTGKTALENAELGVNSKAERALNAGKAVEDIVAEAKAAGVVLEKQEENIDDNYDGHYKRAVEKVADPMGVPQIRLLAKAFLGKLKSIPPRVQVFKNVADMKDANRKLFDKAVASRAPGEFENTPSMGFSFGNDIIIFSDYIAHKRMLYHTLAHEVVGHYGLTSILSKKELTEVLTNIYDNDSHIRALTDRKIELLGISKLEAIEEILADKAASADISTIQRIWIAIKKALTKLTGVTFGDETARYWVNHLRLYARTGQSSFANPQQIARNIRNAENSAERGRFSYNTDHANIVGEWHRWNALNNTMEFWFGNKEYWNRIATGKAFKEYAKDAGGMAAFMSKSIEIVQTLNHKANKNLGLTFIYRFFQDTGNDSKFFMNDLVKRLPTKFLDSTTDAEKTKAFQILAVVAMYRGIEVEKSMREIIKLGIEPVKLDKKSDTWVIDHKVMKELIAAKHVSLADIRAGLKITIPKGEKELEIDAVDLKNFGKTPETKWIFDKNITENSAIWKLVEEHQTAVAYSAANILVGEAQGGIDERIAKINEVRRTVKGVGGESLTKEDSAYLDKVLGDYIRIYTEGAWNLVFPQTDEEHVKMIAAFDEARNKAEGFLKKAILPLMNTTEGAGAFGNLEKALGGTLPEFEYMSKKEYKYILDNVTRIRTRNLSEDTTYQIQNVLQNLWLNESIVENQKIGLYRTVLGKYVPLVRDGEFQVIVKAYRIRKDGSLGRPLKVNSHTRTMLLYTQTDKIAAAKSMMETFNSGMKDQTLDMKDAHGIVHKARLVAEYSETRKEAPRAGPVGYTDLISTLTAAGIRFNPTQAKILITQSTGFKNKARRSLPRSLTPGFEQRNGLRHVAAYLETQSHIAAKAAYRHKITRTMNDDNFWHGDDAVLREYAEEVDEAHNNVQEARQKGRPQGEIDRLVATENVVRYKFERYSYMYSHSRAISDVGELTISGKRHKLEKGVLNITVGGKKYKLKLRGRGERYRDEATKIVAWYEQSTDVVTSTEDILSGKISAQLKMVTVLGQLGGNIATALVNLTSIPMHTVPYLAFHNPVRGVGGGFGLGRATAEITMAGKNLANRHFGTEEFLADMVKNWPKKNANWVNKYGITLDEAEFLLQETRLGILSPAQFNALAGSARGGIEKAKTIRAIKVWMSPFTYTEQLNRRTTALATYRLHRARLEAAGGYTTNQLRDIPAEEANKAVDETQGNYDMYNRPQIARGNIFQYPFMYKQFVLTSVQLLASMPWQGRVTYLGLMFLAAGLKGFPFADDLFDLIDTIAQMLGIKMGSIEMEAHKILDNIAPGASPFIMNGVLDRFSGATVSTRLGHGDLIPLTGAFRAGANFQREAVNLFGPVYAMFTGLATMGKSTLRYGGEVLGFKPDTTRINDILRESPIAALRAMSDGYAYNRDGSITNAQGKVVSTDMTGFDVVRRIAGFYPAVATRENRVVRISKRVSDYTAEIRREFQVAYVKAKVSKNQSRANEISKQVQDWNRKTRGTEFYIKNFRANANRAVREALRPTSKRYLKSSPKNMRKDVEWLMDLYDLN